MRDSEIQEIITACRTLAAREGVALPPITIDTSKIARTLSEKAVAFLTNKSSKMAARMIARANNMEEPNWDAGKVICISDTIITARGNSMQAIGVIVHEMGHAYNIAANLPNTEANAQVFEIEVLLHFRHQNPEVIPGDHAYSDEALDLFFKERIVKYLANDPACDGYIGLHTTIRKIPAFFYKTHEEYNNKFEAHYSTHKNRGSKYFPEAMEALSDIPIMKQPQPKTYPLIKIADKLPFFLRTKIKATSPSPASNATSYTLLQEKGND
jgi:hypothetical protein